MATLKEAIYALLYADAQLHTGTELGSLLGHYATAPYGIYFVHPPDTPDLPLITYFFNSQSGRFPRTININITAWGDNYEAILDRVYTLLHDAVISPTDYKHLLIKWDWAGPEMWDDNLKCYYCQHRFFAKEIKT